MKTKCVINNKYNTNETTAMIDYIVRVMVVTDSNDNYFMLILHDVKLGTLASVPNKM